VHQQHALRGQWNVRRRLLSRPLREVFTIIGET